MQGRYGGKLVNTGIDVEAIPFFPEHDGYAVFVGKQEPRKGWPCVKQVSQEAGLELRTVDGLTGDEKWQAIGRAMVLLHPSVDAAPRTPLEAAACGVPTVCLNEGGTTWHVANGVTGYAVRGWEDMAYWVKVSNKLNRQSIRNWANDCHNLGDTIDGYEDALMSVANGVTW
jgi:glycosyltransferase involved in cell wall biosynthesis